MMVGSVHSDGWTPGEHVAIRRVVDVANARGQAVDRVKVGDDGIVTVEGLEPGVYHLTGDHGEPVRQVRVTVVADAPAPTPIGTEPEVEKLSPEEVAARLERTRPRDPRGESVEGMRSTATGRRRVVGQRTVDVGREAA